MSDFKAIVDSSFDNSNFNPLWLISKEYIYGMIPVDSGGLRWIEVSYSFEDPDDPFVKSERNADLSYQFLLEEVVKAVPFYVEDFNVIKIKEFIKSIEQKSSTERIKELINELISNSSNYSANLPLIKSKEGLEKIKEKL